MKTNIFFSLLAALMVITGCRNGGVNKPDESKDMNADSTSRYSYNKAFLKKHTPVIELSKNNSAIILAPAWQGRVMTSTATGENGYSFGWVNHDLISSGKVLKHMNPFGGEERLWLGPEGGQYSIFFKKGTEFTMENWQTPGFVDTLPFEVVRRTDTSAVFSAEAALENYSGTNFNLKVEREVRLLSGSELNLITGVDPSGLDYVSYLSDNTLINSGQLPWKKESGLISIWMLGMYNPSPSVVVVCPVKEGDEASLGAMVNDNYFGKIASDRLKTEGNHIFFRADGKSRSKIGVPPLRTAGVIGSYDAENNVLTLLFCNTPKGITDYVNSAWQIQDNPYSGDAYNSYNDGPLEDGSQLGPFYEIETSSPAAALEPGGKLTHRQITVHLTGERKLLDKVASKILGVPLEKIETAFK